MKIKFKSILLCMLAVSAFTACSNDDEEPIAPDNNHEPVVVTAFDGLEYLTRSIVEVDAQGNFLSHIYGTPLDAADPTVVSIGVENVEEAKEVFKGWFSSDTYVMDATDYLVAQLKDEEGKAQGEVTFQAGTGAGVLATVTFSGGASVPGISRIEFIPNSMWPTNDVSPYYPGDICEFPTAYDGNKNYICVREATSTAKGIFVYLSHTRGEWGEEGIKPFAYPGNAQMVSEILQKNWNYWVSEFKRAGQTLDYEYYWVDKFDYYAFVEYAYTCQMSSGYVTKHELIWVKQDMKYIQLQWFGMLKTN